MKMVYIAGPFTADTAWDIEQNIRVAESMAYDIVRIGAFPVCPHANGRFFHGLQTPDYWYEGTLELMRRCDGVMLVKNWQRSKGAVKEYEEAMKRHMPIFDNIPCFEQWIKNNIYVFDLIHNWISK